MLVMVGVPSTRRRVTVASVCTDSGGVPAWASRLDRAIEKHDAWAAAISCSGLAPGPSSKRDLYEYSPLMVSPAVNVPLPVGTSPFHSALPLAGMAASSLGARIRNIRGWARYPRGSYRTGPVTVGALPEAE